MRPSTRARSQSVPVPSDAPNAFNALIDKLEDLVTVQHRKPGPIARASYELGLEILQSTMGFKSSRLAGLFYALGELVVNVVKAVSTTGANGNQITPFMINEAIDNINTHLREILTFIKGLADSNPIMRFIQHSQKAALLTEYHSKLWLLLRSFKVSESSTQLARHIKNSKGQKFETIQQIPERIDLSHLDSGDNAQDTFTHLPETDITCQLILRGHAYAVNSIAISPDGSTIASGSYDGTVRLWSSTTGAEICEALVGHTRSVTSVVFSSDGLYLASGSWDLTIRLWDSISGLNMCSPLVGHTDAVLTVASSPDGRHVVSGSRDGTVRLWDALVGVAIGKPFAGHLGSVTSVAFSPDGRLIASGASDRTVRLWDPHTGVMYRPLRGHTGILKSIAFSPDGRSLVSGSSDKTVRVWSTTTGLETRPPLMRHAATVTSVAFSGDGSKMISSSADQTINLWDSTTNAPIGPPLDGHIGVVNSVAFSPDMVKIVSCSGDTTIRIWYKSSASSAEPTYNIYNQHSRVTQLASKSTSSLALVSMTQRDPEDLPQMSDLATLTELSDSIITIETPDEDERTDAATAADVERVQDEMPNSQTALIRSLGLKDHSVDLSQRVSIKDGPLRGGGFCDIYMGELYDGVGAEKVAMKQLRTFLNWNNSQRAYALRLFSREVQLWSNFAHRHILPFHGFAIMNDRQFFMISPWIENGDCIQYLLMHPSTNRPRILGQVADALYYLHSGGAGNSYVHGDIKGDNVLISDDGNALLCDFGLMRHVEVVAAAMATPSGISHTGHIRFAAPELLRNEDERPSPASDVFAFGGLIHQIFTGRPPYPHLNDVQALLAITREEKPNRPESLDVLRFGLDDAMWNLALECWNPTPARRPTMREVSTRLARFV